MKIYQQSIATLQVLALLFSFGCGEQKKTTTIPNTFTPATWNPPPVSAACTMGDFDKDGSCDDVDPNPTLADSDNDGELDGLDTTPTGGSSRSDHLSPLAWGLISVATLATGSLAYNALFSRDCQTTSGLSIKCIETDWESAAIEFQPVDVSHVRMIVRAEVKISREHWFTYGFDLGTPQRGTIEYYFDGEFSPETIVADKQAQFFPQARLFEVHQFYYLAPDGQSQPPPQFSNNNVPIASGLNLKMDPSSCKGKQIETSGTGVFLSITGGPSYCLDWNAMEGFPVAFKDNAGKIEVFLNNSFSTLGNWNKDRLVFRPDDREEFMAIPQSAFPFVRDTVFDPANPLKGLWK